MTLSHKSHRHQLRGEGVVCTDLLRTSCLETGRYLRMLHTHLHREGKCLETVTLNKEGQLLTQAKLLHQAFRE